jgi:hypothetical protein
MKLFGSLAMKAHCHRMVAVVVFSHSEKMCDIDNSSQCLMVCEKKWCTAGERKKEKREEKGGLTMIMMTSGRSKGDSNEKYEIGMSKHIDSVG